MFKFTTKSVAPAIAVLALAGFVGSTISASADPLTNEQPGYQKRVGHRYYRPLTVVRRPAPVVVATPAPAPGVVSGTIGTVVAVPFNILGGIFPAPGPRKGGVTAVRYQNAGAEESTIDEGFATKVPVDKSGPIYVVENGDPTISPVVFISAPLTAAGTLVQTPFRIIGAAGL